jgi:hypothetical protein
MTPAAVIGMQIYQAVKKPQYAALLLSGRWMRGDQQKQC